MSCHFTPGDINVTIGKGKRSLKRSTVPSFREIKEGPVRTK